MDVSVHNTESVEIGEWEKLSSTDKTTTYTKKITIKSKSFMGDGYERHQITLFKNMVCQCGEPAEMDGGCKACNTKSEQAAEKKAGIY